MIEFTNEFENILQQCKGKSANYITHALKMLGGGENGSMAEGMMRIIEVFKEDKRNSVQSAKGKYGMGGLVLGISVTSIMGLYLRKKENEKHEEEKKIILKTFNNEIGASGTEECSIARENKEVEY
jgi:hypothetical protein